MSVMHSPDSEYARERRKWETTHSEYGPPGRPAVFTEYPLMVYKASRPPQGGKEPILEHHIVEDEQQERNLASRGFVRGPAQAIDALQTREVELARAAAERAAGDQRMTPKAQAEAVAADESTIQHLGTIPETPIRRKAVTRE